MAGTRRAVLAAALLAFCLAPAAPGLTAPGDEEPAELETDRDYLAGRAAIAAKDWETAIAALSSAALRHLRDADIQNYLGYAYRHTGRMELAFRHYRRALELDPLHRGAHEYVGEAYLMVGDIRNAEEHLAALKRICATACEEHDDLAAAIAAHRRRTSK